MTGRPELRIALALSVAAAAGLVAFLLPAVAIALAGAGCGLALWSLLRPAGDAGAPEIAARPPAEPGLAEVAASISEPLLFVERQRVTHANAAALALLGAHIVGEDVRLAIRNPAAAARFSGTAGEGDAPVQLAGLGSSGQHWEMTTQMLGQPSGQNGGPAGLLVRLADRSAARAAERMRVDFVANASHELRTPLATLLGFIETLEEANGPQDAATRLRFLKTMMGEARRMQRLIDDLMSLSRIEAEQHSPPQSAVALGDLVIETGDAITVAQAIQRGRIAVKIASDTPSVAGDRAQLSQLTYNLIGNAVKYGRPGTPVRVTVAREGGMVRLSVADEGEGIAREHLPRLTERFYRVDPGRSRAIGGTGLGLAIVKHIVERHRGRLEITSVVGQGTVVSVRLPVAAELLSSKCHGNVTGDTSNPTIGDVENA